MIPPLIIKRIEEIRSDLQSGSTAIAIKGVRLLFDSLTYVNSFEEMEKIKNQIINAKPSMSALKNLLEYSHSLISTNKNSHYQLLMKKVLTEISNASQKTIDNAFNFISQIHPDNIYTCSYSSTVLAIIERLYSVNNNIKINCINSLWKGKNYAEQMKIKLSALNIKSEIIDLDKISFSIHSIAILGADSIISSKAIINGVPSKSFAIIIKFENIPLYILAESFKFTQEIIIENGFEIVEKDFINQIFTSEKTFSDTEV